MASIRRHLRMLIRMMRSKKRGVILFDEADDVFRPPSIGLLSGSSGDADSVSMDNNRASLNYLLEASRIPVVWIMNRPEVLDAAVLRRFDVVIHFEGIPESVRQSLINERFKHRSESDMPQGLHEHRLWAQVATLTPALIDRLGRVSERAQLAGVPMIDSTCRHWLRLRLPGNDSAFGNGGLQ